MRTRLIAPAAVLLLALAGCGMNDDAAAPSDPETVDTTEASPDSSEEESEDNGSGSSDEFVPREPVPADLPVYPGAQLVNDIDSGGEREWQWLYQTTGSGNDIVAYFTSAFESLGFEIVEDSTFAFREEFFISTVSQVVQVYWLAPDSDGVDEDTGNRGYAIVVNLDEWEAR